MNTKMITFTPGDSIGKAIKILREQDISHLPIIENNSHAIDIELENRLKKIAKKYDQKREQHVI